MSRIARRRPRSFKLPVRASLGFAFACLMGVSVIGQSWEVFDMASAGLPSNTVNAIAQGPGDVVWVGTDWGLCKYDGVAWQVFQVGTSGIPENDIRALAVDAQGRLWIGTLSSGLVVYDGATWQQFLPGTSPMPSDQIHNITLDQEGFGWLATTNGMVRTDLSDWRIYNNTDESYNGLILPGTNIQDIAVRSDGLVCVGTLNAGFTYVTGTEVVVYTTVQDGLPDNTALGVAVDGNGDRWLACPSGGLLRNFGDVQGGFWSQYIASSSGVPGNALNDVVIDASDRKIVASQIGGVGILTGIDQWQVYNEQNSALPDNEVRCLAVAPDGAIWAGTATGGAARLAPDQSYVTSVEGSIPVRVFPVPADFEVTVDLGGLSGNGTANWEILDSSGRLIDAGSWIGSRRNQLDVSGYEAGSYFLTVLQVGQVRTARIAVD